MMAKSLIRKFLCFRISSLRMEFLGTFGITQNHDNRIKKMFKQSSSDEEAFSDDALLSLHTV